MTIRGGVKSRVAGLATQEVVLKETNRPTAVQPHIPLLDVERRTLVGPTMLSLSIGALMLGLIHCMGLTATVWEDLWNTRLAIYSNMRQFWPSPIATEKSRGERPTAPVEFLGYVRLGKGIRVDVDEQRLVRIREALERREVHPGEQSLHESMEDRRSSVELVPRMPGNHARESSAGRAIPFKEQSTARGPDAGTGQDSGEADLPGEDAHLEARRLHRMLEGLRGDHGPVGTEAVGQGEDRGANGMILRENPRLEEADRVDCCDLNGSELRGCGDQDCMHQVCLEAEALECCFEQWDASCAEMAQVNCDICREEP